jgi:hypothetical protein
MKSDKSSSTWTFLRIFVGEAAELYSILSGSGVNYSALDLRVTAWILGRVKLLMLMIDRTTAKEGDATLANSLSRGIKKVEKGVLQAIVESLQ